MAGETATAADSTHPTGMHSSCYYENTDFYALKSMYVRTSNILDSRAAGKGSLHSHTLVLHSMSTFLPKIFLATPFAVLDPLMDKLGGGGVKKHWNLKGLHWWQSFYELFSQGHAQFWEYCIHL